MFSTLINDNIHFRMFFAPFFTLQLNAAKLTNETEIFSTFFFENNIILWSLMAIPFLSLIVLQICALSFNLRFNTFYSIGLASGVISYIIALILWLSFNESVGGYQMMSTMFIVPSMTKSFFIGVDGLSILFFLLINIFIFFTIYSLHEKMEDSYLALIFLFLLQVSMLAAFMFFEILSFFIFFEITVLPIFFIVLGFGSRNRRVRAIYLIALYTMLGSIFILFNTIYASTKSFGLLYDMVPSLMQKFFEPFTLWNGFLIAFGIKMPIFPLHIWLPEAHVEAPTIGSVLLAALLLKLGSYGIFRFSFAVFPKMTWMLSPYAVCLAILGIIFTSLIAIAQIDLKKIIAYSSVGHMSMVLLGLLAFSSDALQGAFFQMFSHGIVSGALFFCVGSLYERFKVRSLKYYGGLTFFFPLLATICMIFFMANISFPLTSSFVGEFLILMGLFKHNFFATFFAATSMVLGAVYMLWTFNRVFFGNLKMSLLKLTSDLTHKEFYLYFMLVFLLFFMGIKPYVLLDTLLLDSIQYLNEGTLVKTNLHLFSAEDWAITKNSYMVEENDVQKEIETYFNVLTQKGIADELSRNALEEIKNFFQGYEKI